MQIPWFLTCFAQGEAYLDEMAGMLATFHKFNPGVPAIVGHNPFLDQPWADLARCKAHWMLDVWRKHKDRGAMLWVDADARFRRAVAPPEGPFEIAAQYYGDLAVTGTMWFQGDRIDPTLDLWTCELSPEDEGDEASFQRAIDRLGVYVEPIPREISSICSQAIHGFKGELEHDSSIIHWNRSRKTRGLVDEWPPSEEVRRTAPVMG